MTARLVLAVLFVPLLVGCAGNGVEPRVVEGIADANATGTAIGLRADESDEDGEGYVVAGADSRSGDGPVSGGDATTCIEPGAEGQRVRLGIVEVDAREDGFVAREHVVWVECLD